MDQFWAAPPVTRTLTAVTFAQSVLLKCGLLSYYRIAFVRPFVLKLFPELWRLVTPFFVAGPKLQFFFDLYFLYTYGSNLEMNAPRLNAPGDFLTYVLFVSTVILPTMTEAVPGSEEDHPCISYSPLLFAILLGLYAM